MTLFDIYIVYTIIFCIFILFIMDYARVIQSQQNATILSSDIQYNNLFKYVYIVCPVKCNSCCSGVCNTCTTTNVTTCWPKFTIQNPIQTVYFLSNMLGIYCGNKEINNTTERHIKRRLMPITNISISDKNQLMNSNLAVLNIYDEQFQNNIQRINIERYSKIKNTEHYSYVKRFIFEASLFDIKISQNITIYSGSALALYGVTHTKDIDIIIFNMTLDDIDSKIINKLSSRIVDRLDICVYQDGAFVEYVCPKKRHLTKSRILHHNHSILIQLLSSETNKNIISSRNPFLHMGQTLVNIHNDKTSNKIIQNTIYVGSVRVFTFSLLEQFYINRYNNINDQRFLVILDMYLLRKYCKSEKFSVKSWPSSEDISIFTKCLLRYEKESCENPTKLICNYILEFTD